jgi:uncharacterized protein YjbI with pentapeptide repeats
MLTTKNVAFQNVNFQNVNFQVVNFQKVAFQNVDFKIVDVHNVEFQNVEKTDNVDFYDPTLTSLRRGYVPTAGVRSHPGRIRLHFKGTLIILPTL